MCVAAPVAAGIGLAISAVSTVANIGMGMMQAQQQAAQAQAQLNMQAQQARNNQIMQHQSMVQQQNHQYQSQKLQMQQSARQYNLSVEQNNTQIQNQYEAEIRRTNQERENQFNRYAVDKAVYQRSRETAEEQSRLNTEAANRVYMGEQAKITEARSKAAFEAQAILAKSIGDKGKILAAGRSGQSVGLLVNDVERQAGFATAQETAMAETKAEQAMIGMEGAFLKAQSENAAAASSIAWNPTAPNLAPLPGVPNFIQGEQFEIN